MANTMGFFICSVHYNYEKTFYFNVSFGIGFIIMVMHQEKQVVKTMQMTRQTLKQRRRKQCGCHGKR